MGKKITKVPRTTMEALQRRSWPGNVRELRNVIEHAAIVTGARCSGSPCSTRPRAATEPPRTLADAEREHILRALERARWHVKGPQGAAAQLGLNPSTLYGRMRKLGIRPPEPAEDSSRSGPNTDSRTPCGPRRASGSPLLISRQASPSSHPQ